MMMMREARDRPKRVSTCQSKEGHPLQTISCAHEPLLLRMRCSNLCVQRFLHPASRATIEELVEQIKKSGVRQPRKQSLQTLGLHKEGGRASILAFRQRIGDLTGAIQRKHLCLAHIADL